MWMLRFEVHIATISVLLLLSKNIHSANILFVSVFPSISHQKAFQPVWKELSLRGHNVHAVTPSPLGDPTLTNLTEYDLSFLYERLNSIPQEDKQYVLKKPSFPIVFLKDIYMTYMFSKLSEISFKHEEMQRLIKSDVKFDVVIAEWLFPTMSAFGAKYQCPLIGISSLGAPLVGLDAVGNPSHPISSPDQNLPVTRDMPFRERLMSALYSVYVRTWYHLVVLPREDGLIKKYLGEDMPYLGDIERNVSILLLNRSPVFHRVMPVVPAIIELGGISLNRTKPKLDLELQKFLDKSTQGAIYFSLGSGLKSIYLSEYVINILLDVFGKLPYNVLFKWENDTLPGKPDNVFISKWVPQLTVLDHPNVKLFLMQGGLQSSEEAILAEVPIIGFPTHSDQTFNVDTFVKYGAGLGLDLDYFTAEELNSSIYEIMTNPSYKENAKTLASLMYDQPIDGLKRAIWWIEYVIRHKGAKHLRSPILDIPWWQYFMLDIIAFLLALLCVILTAVYLILKGVYLFLRKILRKLFPKSDKANIKKKQ
ncbi:UDP-glucuronosyltransferase 2B19 isoform X1 [Anoplophora glabripennis]|nr:UDP-glucuronosyltransferase 2B19 isoform X1 [Anoplophora glabripennis]